MSYLFIEIMLNNIVYLTNSLKLIISELLNVAIESKNRLAALLKSLTKIKYNPSYTYIIILYF